MKRSALIFLLFLVVVLPYQEPKDAGTFLTPLQLMTLRGGHGGSSCDTCTNAAERLDECAHFDVSDPCLTNQCIENWLVEHSCQKSDSSDCWARLNPNKDALVQYLRNDSNCTTNNPSTWKIWRIHYYSANCYTREYQTRCTKPSNNCTGTLIDTAISSNGIECF